MFCDSGQGHPGESDNCVGGLTSREKGGRDTLRAKTFLLSFRDTGPGREKGKRPGTELFLPSSLFSADPWDPGQPPEVRQPLYAFLSLPSCYFLTILKNQVLVDSWPIWSLLSRTNSTTNAPSSTQHQVF